MTVPGIQQSTPRIAPIDYKTITGNTLAVLASLDNYSTGPEYGSMAQMLTTRPHRRSIVRHQLFMKTMSWRGRQAGRHNVAL